MKKISLKVITLVVVLTVAGLAVADTSDTTTLNKINGYRKWTQLNPQPIIVTGFDSAI